MEFKKTPFICLVSALVCLLAPSHLSAVPSYDALSRVCVEIYCDGRQDGSGTLVDAGGRVLTASHFLEQPGKYIEVGLSDRSRHPARVIAVDHGHDLALLQIVGLDRKLEHAQVAEQLPPPGTDVFLYSAALFRHGVMNKASIARSQPYYEYMGNKYNAIIHLAAASPGGSSGGSWMNEAGQVLGVQSGNMTINGAPQGVSMIGPLHAIKQLIESGKHAETPTFNSGFEERWAQDTGFIHAYQGDHGLIVRQLQKEGALARAGVHEWDVIRRLEGKQLHYLADLLDPIRKKKPGSKVRLEVSDRYGQNIREAEVTLACLEAAWRKPKRPHVIVVLTDDMGIGDLGITGNQTIESPNTDALAVRSAQMENFYVHPVCAPTRACVMTGRYNYRTRVVDTWIGRAMMDPGEKTVAEVLRDSGYATGIFGKWHLGDAYPLRAMDQGFEEALVHWGGGLAQPAEPRANKARYTDALLQHNGRTIQTKGFCTDVYFDRAIEWMRRRDLSGKPFFVYLPTNAPHGPFHDVPEKLHRKYLAKGVKDQEARIYAMIENIDLNMGKLDAFLEKSGIKKDTLLIYFHDNGPNGKRYTMGLRGAKTHVYEGGIRSPLFVEWPGRIKPGQKFAQLSAHIDLFPTILDAAGVEVPAGVQLDGRSLLPILRGKDVSWPNRMLAIQSHRGDVPVRYHHFAVRQGPWKLLRSSGFGKEAPPVDVPFELYNLEKDPGESTDLATSERKIVDRLKKAYDAWFDDVSGTRPNNYDPPRIIVGHPAERETMLTHQDWRNVTGKGWGDHGEWLIEVDKKRAYNVDVVLRENSSKGTVSLTIGKGTWDYELESPADKIHFKGLNLPKGPATIKAVLKQGEKEMGPDRIFIRQP